MRNVAWRLQLSIGFVCATLGGQALGPEVVRTAGQTRRHRERTQSTHSCCFQPDPSEASQAEGSQCVVGVVSNVLDLIAERHHSLELAIRRHEAVLLLGDRFRYAEDEILDARHRSSRSLAIEGPL